MIFEDRKNAGKKLALKLEKYRDKKGIVLALPRGGVPVGYEIAKELHLPLDVLVVRKVALPQNPEYGIAAVASPDELYVDRDSMIRLNITPREIAEIAEKEMREMTRREVLYRAGKKPLNLKNKIVILTDDGIATGVTVHAALLALKIQNPNKIILAVPGCPTEIYAELKAVVDEIICFEILDNFQAVGSLYKNFYQMTDAQVIAILNKIHD